MICFLIDQSTHFASFTQACSNHASFISLINQNGIFLKTHRPLTNMRAGFASFTYYANLLHTAPQNKNASKSYLLYYSQRFHEYRDSPIGRCVHQEAEAEVVREPKFENTVISSEVQGCTLTDFEFSYFNTICKIQSKPLENLIKNSKIGKTFPTPNVAWGVGNIFPIFNFWHNFRVDLAPYQP